MTYSGYYLRRTSAESALRTCRRRGWDPVLRRVLGVWLVQVSIEPAHEVVAGVPETEERYQRLAASGRRTE